MIGQIENSRFLPEGILETIYLLLGTYHNINRFHHHNTYYKLDIKEIECIGADIYYQGKKKYALL